MHRVVERVIVPVTVLYLGFFPVAGCCLPRPVKQADGGNLAVQLTTGGGIGSVYVMGDQHVARLDGRTGHVVWTENGPGFCRVPTPVRSGPVIAGPVLVYVNSGDNGIFGLSLRTGKLKWVAPVATFGLAAGPDAVYSGMQEGWGEVAVNARNGRTEWTSYPKAAPEGPGVIRYFEGRLYANSSYVLDARTGRVLVRLSRRVNKKFNLSLVYPSDLKLREGHIFFAAYGELGGVWDHGLGPVVALDARTGRVLWTAPNPLRSVPGTDIGVELSASARYLAVTFYQTRSLSIVHAHHALVRVFDVGSGRLLWEKKVASHNVALHFYLASIDNYFLYLVEPIRQGSRPLHNPHRRGVTMERVVAYSIRTGRRKWTYVIPNGFWKVVPVGRTVFVSGWWDNDHLHVIALNRATGALRWTFSFHHGNRKCLSE